MNPERRQLWVDALRSGKYQQGVGRLNRNNLYCCLGVLCEVAMENGLKLNKAVEEKPAGYAYDDCQMYPPNSVTEWLGISWGQTEFLASINDKRCGTDFTFDEIANIIAGISSKAKMPD